MLRSDQPIWTLGASLLFPVSGPPLEEGVITIEGTRIVCVEACSSLKPDIYFENAAVTPGLVNAHTHLDLTGLRGKCPPQSDFTAWLRAVIGYRRQRAHEAVCSDIAEGLAEAVSFGTTLLGDISSQGWSWSILSAGPIRAVVFLEVLGLPRARSGQAKEEASIWLQSHPANSTCRAGVSPHAPYSVRAELFEEAAAQARQFQSPLATHLAETRAELDLLASHSGPFVTFLQELGVWDEEGLIKSSEELIRCCAGARTLLVHGNYLDAGAPIRPGHTVVYCPRTHAAFGHEPHPFREFLKRGVKIALGTDSLASNPDLDLFAEARYLHRCFPDLPGDLLLRLATLAGAEALGWDAETGSLEPGKSADLAVIPVSLKNSRDPYVRLLESTAPPRAVLCRGQWIHGNHS